MPLFICDQCGCIENTALSMFWCKDSDHPLCSECDADRGKWHGQFEKREPTEKERKEIEEYWKR